MGGKEAFTNYLIQLCNQEPYFSPEQYGYEIHEMSEMAQVNLGQLAISNQPSFHIPYLSNGLQNRNTLVYSFTKSDKQLSRQVFKPIQVTRITVAFQPGIFSPV